MKKNLKLILLLLSIIFSNYSYSQTSEPQKHITHTIIHHTNIRHISPEQIVIDVPCLTNDNVNITITCTIMFKSDVTVVNKIDTLRLEETIFKSTRRLRSDSLTSQNCLNQLGWEYQQYFKGNKQIKFVKYAIEFDPNNYTTKPVTH